MIPKECPQCNSNLVELRGLEQSEEDCIVKCSSCWCEFGEFNYVG